MSDLKLYNGINNIDDDLIEEAGCKQKPVIHHCYPIAATAAALFIAVGAVGVFRTSRPVRNPDIPENEVISEESTTAPQTSSSATYVETVRTSAAKTSSGSRSETTSPTAESKTASIQTSVSYSKTTSLQKNSHKRTTAASVNTTQTEAFSNATVTEAVQTDSPPVQDYDFEYEGSIIMKKYAAALTALLAATGSVSPIQSQAETYEPEVSESALSIKQFVEESNIDLDINSDGKLDVFDVYAAYRCETGNVDGVPVNIREKYDALPKKWENASGEKGYLNYDSFAEYYFTYYDLRPEYFDPNYYIDNCPDTYDDELPLDVIKQAISGIEKWDDAAFTRTIWYVRNDDGTFRPFCKDDIDRAYFYDEESGKYTPDNNFFAFEAAASPIHEFIRNFKSYYTAELFLNNELMDLIIKSDMTDVDINSDGVYDFDDIVLIEHYLDNFIFTGTYEYDSIIAALDYHETSSYQENYPAELREAAYCPLSEDEWNKAHDFIDTVRYYFAHDALIIKCMTENYLLENTVDPKYFDPVYYAKNHLAEYEFDKCWIGTKGELFGTLGYYEYFSLKYGPGSEKNKALFELADKREIYYEDEVNAAFPTYYKNVKTGKLPVPDMDLDGETGIADYLILEEIDDEYVSIGGRDPFAPLVRRYPEIKAEISISPEARENYMTNFDFNNNGISCDFLETECMRMYIFGELESQYESREDLCDAIYNYLNTHPDMKYSRISAEKMEELNQKYGVNFTPVEDEEEEETYELPESVDIIQNYSSFNQVFNSPEVAEGAKGDANGDGIVDISDAVLIMQYISNPSKYGVNGSDNKHITQEGYLRADVDGQGVTNMDALTIQKFLLGLGSIE
ncbi:MAG TPA: dockerin type I domain-containing protein [Ruminococcus flavefaciens]|nr:dockerin type I domain-containing protein [Ruminococcus flavefaciens]HQM01735.1 dockerin type I domain-containing protein [Ruminococcus flavefaciens]